MVDTKKTKLTYVTFENVELEWAKVHPNQREMQSYDGTPYLEEDGIYKVDVLLESPVDQLKAREAHLALKPHKTRLGVYVISPKRENQRKTFEGEFVHLGPPQLLYSATEGDMCMTPLPESIQIGNGSRGNVSVWAKIYTKEGLPKKATPKLQGIQVTDLKAFRPKGGHVDTSGNKTFFAPVEGVGVANTTEFVNDEVL